MIDYTYIYGSFMKGDMTPLYTYMYRGLMLYAIRILGDDVAYVAEDCVQDAIMNTYINRGTLDSVGHWKSYILTCVHNSAVMILRKRNATSNYLNELEHTDTQAELMVATIRQETLDTLYAAIDSLPDKYREMFDLSFEQGLKNREIAEMLNIAEGTVKKRKSHLLDLLRKAVGLSTDDELMLIIMLSTLSARA
ncbi:MAG: sigma-70 family RNA polymerase sigma factor [Bacteroides sp.]|nr:sigma-70 family RNA polymerase sigma factor [Bacteroides sp.]